MTYKRLYEDALFKLEHNKITLGEFEEMIKPLEREIEQEPILDKLRAEIKELPTYYHEIRRPNSVVLRDMVVFDEVLKILDKYKAETEKT